MSKRSWIIFTVIVVGLITGLVVWSKSSSVSIDTNNIDVNKIQPASEQNGNIGDHAFGKLDSKVVLIGYGDFQCPACGSTHPGMKAITEQYQDHIVYIFRNFPLTNIHQNAKVASGAVEAAGLQGKYWEMYDLVYESQDKWSNLSGTERTDEFASYATSLGLDAEKFISDLSSDAVSQKIAFDLALGKSVGVNSTPTFYLDGQKVDGSIVQDVQQGNGDSLRDALDSSLKAAGATPPKR